MEESDHTDGVVDERATSKDDLGVISRRSLLSSIGVGVTGLAMGGAGDTVSASESEPAAQYVEESEPATTATSDGSWSDSVVWSNGVPAGGANVRIDPGVTITVDETTEDIKTLDVAGTLTFARDADSNLRAETIVTRPDSTMHIGTESSPIQQGNEARITFVHHEDISEKDTDPERISKGLLAMGELEIRGAEKTSWDELASAPAAGDTTIELGSAPTNWTAGDEIVVPGVAPHNNHDEERTIASVSGATVELDTALEHDHAPPENNLDVELTAYALNLSRNVVLESEVQERDPDQEQRINRQGHMMVMQPAQSLHNFRTIHLGRTNKKFKIDNPPHGSESSHGDEPNPQARYSVHFHMTGLDAEPHEVSGVVAQNSPGWGIVNHYSHATVRDSITYQVYGAGFVAESGPERGAFERCFALRSRGKPNNSMLTDREGHPEFGFDGNGFWFQGPGVAMENCVAAGHDTYGFGIWGEPLYNHPKFDSPGGANYPNDLAIEDGLLPADANPDGATKSKHLPFKSFTNNTVFASGGGLNYGDFDGISDVKKSVVETFTVYNIRSFGGYGDFGGNRAGEGGKCAVTQRYADHLLVRNPQFCNNDVGGGHGIRRNFYPVTGHEEGGVIEGFDVGIETTDQGTEPIRDVTFVDNGTDIDQKPMHDVGPLNLHVENVDFSDSGRDLNLNFDWGHTHPFKMFSDELNITLDGEPVYFDQQAPEYVPFENSGDIHRLKGPHHLRSVFGLSDMDAVESEIPGKTNEELQAEYGTSIYDELMPPEAESHPNVDGGTVGGSNGSPGGDVTLEPKAIMTDDPVTAEATDLADSDGSIDRVEWTFGNGAEATGETVTTSYDDGGDYEVTAHIIDDDGSGTLVSRTAHVVDELNPPTNPGPVSNGLRYELVGHDRSGVHDGPINLAPIPGAVWKEGIDYSGYLLVPETGAYNLTLTANKEATVYIDDEAVLSIHTEYPDDPPKTDTTGIGLEAGLHEFRVDYWEQYGGATLEVELDGPGMSGEIPADALYYEDEDGEVVSEMPQATFSTTDESGTTVSFDASESSAPNGSISSYEWQFGDGASGSGATVEHSYDSEGEYDVALTVTDDAGQSDEVTKAVTVSASGDSGGSEEPESVTDAIDEDDDGEIDDTEIRNALDYWAEDEAVPGTDGKTIDEQTLLELVDSWQEDESE